MSIKVEQKVRWLLKLKMSQWRQAVLVKETGSHIVFSFACYQQFES